MDATNNNAAPNGGKNIEMTPDGHAELLNRVAQFKIEERDMALDRYRRVDADMQTKEEVFTMSKSALGYLHAASSASNTLNDIVKEMGKIIHKTDQPTIVNNSVMSDEERRFMAERMQEMVKKRRQDRKNG
ncbi:MAG: hypothetical protein P8J32_08975, partial [bacterium]|nr:hypothetical protein [bacterium]